jgi:AraC-like DNA-binding protein
MPGMDGLQLTSHIRKNSKTSHIPVILLTALSGNSVQLDSVNKGADLFLTKPIDETLLLAQIENILANRDNLAERYATNNATPISTGNKFSFIERAEKYILDNIRNEQLDINMLARELNISRSSLHRKIKTETNQSSTEFIRDVRLKYAIRLMNDNIYNMDEIAVLTGFNSTSWFNRSFKQKYGKTPKKYKNERIV